MQTKLTRAGGRADVLVKDARPDAEKVEELFMWAFARKPTQPQLQTALAHIAQHAQNKNHQARGFQQQLQRMDRHIQLARHRPRFSPRHPRVMRPARSPPDRAS